MDPLSQMPALFILLANIILKTLGASRVVTAHSNHAIDVFDVVARVLVPSFALYALTLVCCRFCDNFDFGRPLLVVLMKRQRHPTLGIG